MKKKITCILRDLIKIYFSIAILLAPSETIYGSIKKCIHHLHNNLPHDSYIFLRGKNIFIVRNVSQHKSILDITTKRDHLECCL